MTIFSKTPPWKLALGALLAVVLFIFIVQLEAQTQSLTEKIQLLDVLGVIQWILGLCAAAMAALGYTVYMGMANRIAEMEEGQKIERLLRRRSSAATLSLLLMLHPDSTEMITERFKRVMENGEAEGK